MSIILNVHAIVHNAFEKCKCHKILNQNSQDITSLQLSKIFYTCRMLKSDLVKYANLNSCLYNCSKHLIALFFFFKDYIIYSSLKKKKKYYHARNSKMHSKLKYVNPG